MDEDGRDYKSESVIDSIYWDTSCRRVQISGVPPTEADGGLARTEH
jgi:hypothetical protein